jgi:hypothetical protein
MQRAVISSLAWFGSPVCRIVVVPCVNKKPNYKKESAYLIGEHVVRCVAKIEMAR